MKCFYGVIFLLGSFAYVNGQSMRNYADSIRIAYQIPELAYAVVSADTIVETAVLGTQRVNSNYTAKPNDRFHIGSNTKAITSFIAAMLVEEGKIKWSTKIFDLFPELIAGSRKIYLTVTLEDLLTFRGKLPGYSYTNQFPVKKQITGDNHQQRYLLAKYFLKQQPMKEENGITPSNADYIIAGLMLEKASGNSYKNLVTSFGQSQGIDFGFDYPNMTDTLQPWGHDQNLQPVPPFDNYKLNWLLSAGNINISLPQYIKFIQIQLKGLKGLSPIFPAVIFDRLLFGKPTFAFGWFNAVENNTGFHIASNEGNAGAFITRVQIIKETGMSFILFTNSATKKTSAALTLLSDQLRKRYAQ